MVYGLFIIIGTNTPGLCHGATPLMLGWAIAPLFLVDLFKGYLLHSVDKHKSKASNSAGQAPAPLKSNIGGME